MDNSAAASQDEPYDDDLRQPGIAGREDEGEGDEREEDAAGGGGGIHFEETETDFDPTVVQGQPVPLFRRALKKGLKLVSRITEQSDRYLREFLPDKALRSRVVEATLSEHRHPTLVLDNGGIVQYQLAGDKLERVRVSADMAAEEAVRFAMAGFLARGESIDPKKVKFGRTPEFEARMKPVWVREWKRIQAENDANPFPSRPRLDESFEEAVRTQAPPPKPPGRAPVIDLPRGGGGGRSYRPEF